MKMLLFKKDKTHPTGRAVCKHSATFGAQLSTVDPHVRPDPKSPKATGQTGSWGEFLEVLQDRLLRVCPTRAGHGESPLFALEQAICLQASGETVLGVSSWDKYAMVVEELLGKCLAERPPASFSFDGWGQQPSYHLISRIKYTFCLSLSRLW